MHQRQFSSKELESRKKSFMRGLGRGEATVRTMSTHVQKHQKDSRQTRGGDDALVE